MTNAALEQTNAAADESAEVAPSAEPDLAEASGTDVPIDEPIEVSPFLMLRGRFGLPLWIRKAAVIAVKPGLKVGSFQSISENPETTCTIFAYEGVFEVAHDALEVMAELGQGEL